jgi:lincosamide and streptogramin A transport system ATP-binding/permease protein
MYAFNFFCGELAERYERHNGYVIDTLIERECADLGISQAMLQRPYSSLSGGEQTRSMIAALFLKAGSFPLLDEPTNHLDMNGRTDLAEYLSRKKGFIVVSHDRWFLDRCCDHTIALSAIRPRRSCSGLSPSNGESGRTSKKRKAF